jgi:two-component system, response regulator
MLQRYSSTVISPRADVLVVDDSDSDAELTTLALHRARPELAVLRACDGAQAVQLLCPEGVEAHSAIVPPRLMLLDCNMPVLNGLETLQALRRSPVASRMTVILLSSVTDPAVRRRALDLGASDCIVKPLSFTGYCVHLKAVIERWLGSADGVQASRRAALAF